jgi:hypothetical protein
MNRLGVFFCCLLLLATEAMAQTAPNSFITPQLVKEGLAAIVNSSGLAGGGARGRF